GSLLFTGEQKVENTSLQLITYNKEEISENSFDDINDVLIEIDKTEKMSWLNVIGLHDTDIIRKIVDHFKLHKLTGEDILSVGQRPKLDDYDHYIHIVARMCRVNNAEIEDEQVTIIFGERILITFQEK